ncbi:MazG family protein [Rhodococcus aetherivorans]|uniref:MazG family protein n=1 Tax=Rhodococcus aetherivorans TaxID=191292 RepID=UPI00045D0094|nr:MazG family protein [Rhodococcus aetherivorans]KDE15326.1 nucleoside triphosphate hydrolase [Rhodococcus aetherivorans]MDV6292739.1 MazG family protein [Rhodococcus aetherivorans]
MTVILLDPYRPGSIPIEAVPLLGGRLSCTDDVPGSVREMLCAEVGSANEILIAVDADHEAVQERLRRGERLIAAPPVPGERLLRAVDVMDRLWGFGGWEVTQTHDSLRRYLLEETYELLDAIEEGDPHGLREELGDLLLQVLFHSQIAQESGTNPFTVDDVADTLVTKLALRSPHLTNGHTGPIDVADQEAAWEAAKAVEKARSSCLDGIAMAQPALALTEKVIARATKAGLPAHLIPGEMCAVRIDGTSGAEDALRSVTLGFSDAVRAAESAARTAGIPDGELDAEAWIRYWPR